MEEDTKGTDHETYGKQWYRFACLHKVCMVLGSVVQKLDSNSSSLHGIIRYLMNTKCSWQLWWIVNVYRLSALCWSKLILITNEQEIQIERSEIRSRDLSATLPVNCVNQWTSSSNLWATGSRSLNFTEKVNRGFKNSTQH